jgi:hypothetical protein
MLAISSVAGVLWHHPGVFCLLFHKARQARGRASVLSVHTTLFFCCGQVSFCRVPLSNVFLMIDMPHPVGWEKLETLESAFLAFIIVVTSSDGAGSK